MSGTSSTTQTVTLSNSGTNSLTISSIGLSGIDANSFRQSNNCPSHLSGGDNCTISASFTPATAGSFNAMITIAADASPSKQTIALSGLAPSVAVSVSPATASLNSGQTAQLTAIVSNTANKAATWFLSPVGAGSVSQSGLYTAPATIATAQAVTVKATSQADTTASSSATIQLLPSAAVSVSPATASLNSGQTAQLTAIVSNTANKAVTWFLSPVGAGSVSQSGFYTAPAMIATAQAVTVTATSQADTTASSSATIQLLPSTAVSVSPATASLNSGQTAQLTATVTHALNANVTWSALLGTITPEGLYTAPPNTGSSMLTDTVTATSMQDPTQSAIATITVPSALVGWWPLNEGTGTVAYDHSGQGNNGTWSGTPSSPGATYYASGESALSTAAGYMNGTDNGLTIGTQSIYNFTGPFTISMWINPASSKNAFIFGRETVNNGGYALGLYPAAPKFCLQTSNEVASCAQAPGAGVGVWTLVTTVYDGTNLNEYINGILLATASSIPPPANNGILAFGIPEQGGWNRFYGSLEDIRIYSRALSANEVTSLYDATVTAPNAPTNLQAFPGNGQVGLSWNTPTLGALVTDYTVNYRQSGTSTWIAFPHDPSVVNQRIVTGLTNATSYDFEVISVSAAGNGPASSVVNASPTSNPLAITISVTPNATSATSSSPDITFTATVTHALNANVTWSALLGTITPEGLYTAPPNTGSSMLTDTVTATSMQDPTQSAIATITVPSALVGWWPLNEGTGTVAYDHSGQGNNGTWSGTPSSPGATYYASGESALSTAAGYMNGTDNGLTIGTQSIYNFTGPFTISMWINPASSKNAFIFGRETVNNGGYALGLYPAAPKFCLQTSNEVASCAQAPGAGVGVWTLVTTVYDGTNLNEYINGILLATASSIPPPANNGILAFGIPEQGGWNRFYGSLEDIRIYSRALSANEVTSLYDATVTAPNAPTNLQAFPGNGQVGLSWNTPTLGALVTDYTVNYRQSGTSTWIAFPHDPSVVNQRIVTGLTNATSYDFEVISVSAAGNGPASSVVNASPRSDTTGVGSGVAPSDVVASDDDEFIGPFSSWLNVKTNFGAVGDGVTDDTIAFQYALNALQSPTNHSPVLYVPAGIYNITSALTYTSRNCNISCAGKSIIGESPTNTFLRWHGDATGPAMFTLDGIYRMQFDRLTLDGRGAQITLVNETMHQGCCYDGSNEYTDDVFENAAIGIQAGDNTVGCCSAETKVDRDTFANLTKAGISLEDWNALDWYVRYSIFEHDLFGVTNVYGEGGAVHLDHNLFEYNDTDSGWGNGASQSYTYNTSYHSGTFLAGSPYGNASILIGNTILMPQAVAIVEPGIGPLTLIDNTIAGSITAAQYPSISFKDGSTSTPNSYVTSLGNTYASSFPFSVQNVTYETNSITGDLTSINDAVVSISAINDTLPRMPGPLPNYHRAIYEVPQEASAATIQTVIYKAIAENNGNRPVVHIPWGQYSVGSTITIPGNSDVQVVGDSTQTTLTWTGSTTSPVFALLAPSHAELRNLTVNAGSASAGISVEGNDQPGDRIFTNFVATGNSASLHNLLVDGFDNTIVQMDDFGHGGLTNVASTSVLVVGGPLSQQGYAAPGYTGLFMGASCCSTYSYRVEEGATLVVAGYWYEQGGPGWLNLDQASGNFIGYQNHIDVPSSAGSLVPFSAKNFTGNLTIANSDFGIFDVNLAGATSANVLLIADSFPAQDVDTVSQPPVLVGTNSNIQAATIYPTSMLGSIRFTLPDDVSTGTSRTSLIEKSLNQLARYKDPALTDLPGTNEDVRLVDVIVNNGVNSFDFESVAPSVSQGDHVSRAGNNPNALVAAPTLSPTNPWCKIINTDGAAAGSTKTRGTGGSRRVSHGCALSPQ
jgi:uncharacterized protein YjdB